jgi:hypothetical protein
VNRSVRTALGVIALGVAAAVVVFAVRLSRCSGDRAWLLCTDETHFDPLLVAPDVLQFAAREVGIPMEFVSIRAKNVNRQGFVQRKLGRRVEYVLQPRSQQRDSKSHSTTQTLLDLRGVSVLSVRRNYGREGNPVPVCETRDLFDVAMRGLGLSDVEEMDLEFGAMGYLLEKSSTTTEGVRKRFLVTLGCDPLGQYVVVRGTVFRNFEDTWFVPCHVTEAWEVLAQEGTLPPSPFSLSHLPANLMSPVSEEVQLTGWLSPSERGGNEFSRALHVLQWNTPVRPCGGEADPTRDDLAQ